MSATCFLLFFFSLAIFSGLRCGPCAVNTGCTVVLVGALPAGRDRELPAHVGQDFVQLGSFPCDVVLPASGSSNSEAAKAPCTATARSPGHRATYADCAAGRMGAGAEDALWQASRHSQVAASAPNRPPTSTPTTSKRQRRARTSSGTFAAVCGGLTMVT